MASEIDPTLIHLHTANCLPGVGRSPSAISVSTPIHEDAYPSYDDRGRTARGRFAGGAAEIVQLLSEEVGQMRSDEAAGFSFATAMLILVIVVLIGLLIWFFMARPGEPTVIELEDPGPDTEIVPVPTPSPDPPDVQIESPDIDVEAPDPTPDNDIDQDAAD